MARRAAAELAEFADLVQRHGQFVGHFAVLDLLARRPGAAWHRAASRHGRKRARSGRGPGQMRIGRIVAQHLVPQRIGDRRQRHGRAGMAALGRFDRIHGQRADRVDRKLIEMSCLLSVAGSPWPLVLPMHRLSVTGERGQRASQAARPPERYLAEPLEFRGASPERQRGARARSAGPRRGAPTRWEPAGREPLQLGRGGSTGRLA